MIWVIAILALLLSAVSLFISCVCIALTTDIADAVNAVITKLQGAQRDRTE